MEKTWHIRFARLFLLIIAGATVFALSQVLSSPGWSGISFLVAGITGVIASVFLLLKDSHGSSGKQKRLLAIALAWCMPVLCLSIFHSHPTMFDRIFMIAIWIFLMFLALAYTFKRMVLDGTPVDDTR